MTRSDEASHAEPSRPKPTQSPFDSGWRGLVLAVLAPLPFYPIVAYGMFLYAGPDRSPHDLTYWEIYAMNILAFAGAEVLKWFIRRKFREQPKREREPSASVEKSSYSV